MESLSATLPQGIAHNGSRVRRVTVRSLDGHDQRFLTEQEASLSPARMITMLLARLVSAPEHERPVSLHDIRKLTAGDREALLLHVCRNIFGERVACVLACPECTEAMNLDVTFEELLVSPGVHPAAECQAETAGHTVVLRPVTGADLEAIPEERSAAVEQVLRACLVSAIPPLPEGPLSAEVAEALSEKLSSIDPQADLLLEVTCPDCGHAFQAPFDAGDFVMQGLKIGQRNLEEEIHALAFSYHWTEEAILALPLRRRRRYCEMISSAFFQEDV